MFYKSKDLSNGLKIEINNIPYVILNVNFTNIGRGQAFNKLKLKNILNNTLIFKTVKTGEKIKAADILNKTIQFLYQNDMILNFFHEDDSEYYEVDITHVKICTKWLTSGMLCEAIFWNEEIISVKSPKIIISKVICDNAVKKDLGTHKNFKYVILENDYLIKVPIFIKQGDMLKIDTEDEIFLSRINN